MHITPFVDALRRELAVAAEAGGDDARALADRLTAPLESAAHLMLLEALTAAADEITRDLAPGSVEVRLRGREPSFVVTPGDDDPDAAGPGGTTDRGHASDLPTPPLPPDGDGGTSRLNLRLPDSLKQQIEEAARQEGLSLNAWMVRAAAAALEPGGARPASRSHPVGGQRYTGWVR